MEAADGVDENGDAAVTNAGTYLVTAKNRNGLVWRLDPIEEEAVEGGGSGGDLETQGDEHDEYYYAYGVNTTTDDQSVVITVAPASIKDCQIGEIEDQTYDGKEKTPEPVVVFTDMTLVKDKDYTLSYENNIEVGKATVTITGKGNFTDSVTIDFNIVSGKEDKPSGATSKEKTPNTGDAMGTAPIAIAIIGIFALALAVFARRRRLR